MSKKNETKAQTTTSVGRFERFERGSQEVEHHLFKLKVAKMKKNMSWVYRQPTIVEMEHTHFFHSINDTTLQPNRFSSPTGGHFHEVKLEIDPETGEILRAVCGPAVATVHRRVAGGRTIKRIEKVRWERYNEGAQNAGDSDDEFKEFEPQPGTNEAPIITEFDDHTHDLEYLGFEKFSSQSKAEKRKEETAKVRGLMGGRVSHQPGAMQKLENGPGAADARRVLVEGAESGS